MSIFIWSPQTSAGGHLPENRVVVLPKLDRTYVIRTGKSTYAGTSHTSTGDTTFTIGAAEIAAAN